MLGPRTTTSPISLGELDHGEAFVQPAHVRLLISCTGSDLRGGPSGRRRHCKGTGAVSAATARAPTGAPGLGRRPVEVIARVAREESWSRGPVAQTILASAMVPSALSRYRWQGSPRLGARVPDGRARRRLDRRRVRRIVARGHAEDLVAGVEHLHWADRPEARAGAQPRGHSRADGNTRTITKPLISQAPVPPERPGIAPTQNSLARLRLRPTRHVDRSR